MKKVYFILLGVALFTACTKDRVPTLQKNGTTSAKQDSIGMGMLKINEIMATGSPDFFEIYNTTSQTVQLDSGKFFFTDNLASLQKSVLTQRVIIPANGFAVVYCATGSNIFSKDSINANFSLSSVGEQVGLSYFNNGVLSVLDSITFSAQNSGTSFGRVPDGSTHWQTLAAPSPGASND